MDEETTRTACAYIRANGPIPDGLFVCHRCDNPAFVNPDHLFLGSHTDNVRDMLRKGRGRTKAQCARGTMVARARLDEAQVSEIRKRYAAGGVTQMQLAAEFGIKQPNVSEIVLRKTWTHI